MAYAVYGSGEANTITGIKYGMLYNWYTVIDPSNIANTGWHVAKNMDVSALVIYLDPGGTGQNNSAGGPTKETGLTYWQSPNTGATNTTNFNARGTGYRTSSGSFSSLKGTMWMWNYEQQHSSNGTISIWEDTDASLLTSMSGSTLGTLKGTGLPVRLVKDSTSLNHGQTSTYTGNDGKIYRTICIGSGETKREWTADNIAETKYRTGQNIPEVINSTLWAASTTGARCSYDNTENNVFSAIDTGAVVYKFNGQFLGPSGTIGGLVSISAPYLQYYDDGTPYTVNYITVTSSSAWAAYTEIDTKGVLISYTTNGTSGQSCAVYVQNSDAKCGTAIIRFEVGTARAYLYIYVDGTDEGC